MKEQTIFVCSFCKTWHDNKVAAEQCEEQCKLKFERRLTVDKWYEENPPKFKVGDLVHINTSHSLEEYPNSYFVVEDVAKSDILYFRQWRYKGNTGYTYMEGGVDSYYICWVPEDILELVMDKETYEKQIESIANRFNIQNKNLVKFSRTKDAFEVTLPYKA